MPWGGLGDGAHHIRVLVCSCQLCEGKAEPPAEPTVAPDAPLTYKGTPINKVWRKFMVLAGDFGGTARGGHSALGSKYFEDENFVGRHTARGTVSMANAGVDTNSSTFFIAAKPMPHLGETQPHAWCCTATAALATRAPSSHPVADAEADGRNVVFGHVVEGLELLDKIEATFTQNGEPVNEVVIEDCGAL